MLIDKFSKLLFAISAVCTLTLAAPVIAVADDGLVQQDGFTNGRNRGRRCCNPCENCFNHLWAYILVNPTNPTVIAPQAALTGWVISTSTCVQFDGTSQFMFLSPGLYEISLEAGANFVIPTASGSPSLALLINGLPFPGNAFGVPNTGLGSMTVQVSVCAGDTLQIINNDSARGISLDDDVGGNPTNPTTVVSLNIVRLP